MSAASPSDPRPSPAPRLTVVIPVYNEADTLAELLARVRAVPIPKQIVVVDDHSTDGTAEIIAREALAGDLEVITHPVNRGKGAAIRSGLARVSGEVVVIQDADLEYDPGEYPMLLAPIEKGITKVVYGSRFLGGPRTAIHFWHAVGNRFLTLVANVLFDTILTDMETCYKVMTADVARSLRLRSDRWGIDPEITAKILKGGHRIYEVPISYAGREFHQGKKISWQDGFTVLLTLFRYRFFD
jgi:glycosyltransferase involved in cell wall biosynthesis